MRQLIASLRLIGEVLTYAVLTRRLSLAVVVVLGLVVLLIAAAAQTVTPLVLYPFA